jgi:hypothetical protein
MISDQDIVAKLKMKNKTDILKSIIEEEPFRLVSNDRIEIPLRRQPLDILDRWSYNITYKLDVHRCTNEKMYFIEVDTSEKPKFWMDPKTLNICWKAQNKKGDRIYYIDLFKMHYDIKINSI